MDYPESNAMRPAAIATLANKCSFKATSEEWKGKNANSRDLRKGFVKTLKRSSPEKDFSEAIQQIYLELTNKKKKVEEQLVVPIAPDLITHKRSAFRKTQFKTTEEMEVEEMEQGRSEVMQQLRENSRYYKRALEGFTLQIRSDRVPTTHDEITLRTEQRSKAHQRYLQEKQLRLQEALRQFEEEEQRKSKLPKAPTQPLTMTAPKPFNFASDRRMRRPSESPHEFISLQQQMADFYAQRSVLRSESAGERKTTCPKSPNFELSKRPVLGKVKTAEEAEWEEVKNYPRFRALPVNERILYGKTPIGIPVVEHRPNTTFKEFSLSTESNLNPKYRQSVVEEKTWKLEVVKLNKSILAEPDFVPLKCSKPPTEPEPFNFNTDKRVSRKSVGSVSSCEPVEFKALPMPSYPSQPFAELPKHKPTEPTEFKLHTARLERSAVKASNGKESLGTFKALPVPAFKPPAVRKLSPKAVQVVEFTFATDKRKRPTVPLEEPISTFKARGVPDYERGRVSIKKSARAPTRAVGVALQSEKRSVERAKFDMQQLALAEAEAQRRRAAELEELQREELEVKELRKSMTFKAGGILKGKPLDVKPSQTALTVPQAPSLATEKRASKPKDSSAESRNKENYSQQLLVTQ
eukprot:TRINITY_DN15_c0_g3_i1.p1 TRINITY_DN15_c0_g3~~TRINITY_DN15_c0_g3_i1.p1  ORF type:complete len:636 (+),score=171.34 TRINITY_DN15_c0_g3_i1:139-2046(+)